MHVAALWCTRIKSSVTVISHENLRREFHRPHGAPISVTWLPLRCQQKNISTFTALIGDTRWSTRKRIRRISRLMTSA